MYSMHTYTRVPTINIIDTGVVIPHRVFYCMKLMLSVTEWYYTNIIPVSSFYILWYFTYFGISIYVHVSSF